MTRIPAAAVAVAAALFTQAPAPAALPQAWALETRGRLPQAVVVHAADPRFVFVAMKSGGLGVLRIDTPGRPPRQVATVARAALGNLDAMNLTARGSLLFVALGDLFAAGGSRAGLAAIDVSAPDKPAVVGRWASPTVMKGSAAVVVDDRYAYLGAMTQGVMIFDVANPAAIAYVTTFQPDVNFPRARPNAIQHPNARGLALVADRLFVAYDAGGLRVLDVSNRTQPREIGRYVNAGMRTKQQAFNNVAINGSIAWVAVDYAGLEAVDISNPAAMRQVGWWNPWKAETAANTWFNSPGHTNQIELDRARGLAYLSAGDSDLQVIDISNPRAPMRVASHGAVKDGRGVWGLGLGPDVVYLAYIQALLPFRGTWSGVVAVRRSP